MTHPELYSLNRHSINRQTEDIYGHLVCERERVCGCDVVPRVFSARVHAYMLEKARLTCPPQQQQNFSIFHLMAEGLSAEEKSGLYLNNLLVHRCVETPMLTSYNDT